MKISEHDGSITIADKTGGKPWWFGVLDDDPEITKRESGAHEYGPTWCFAHLKDRPAIIVFHRGDDEATVFEWSNEKWISPSGEEVLIQTYPDMPPRPDGEVLTL